MPLAVPIHRDVVSVRGPEAVGFLQGQLSQDVEALPVGASAPTFLLQPTGKVDAWLRVTRVEGDELVLDVDPGYGDAVLARLRRYLLRTKADIEPATWSGAALRGDGAAAVTVPQGARRLPAAWPGDAGAEAFDVLGPGSVTLEVPLGDPQELELARITAGVPAMGAEITEHTIPAELGQWVIDASVSFTKGCYTGQELVARIDSRGGNVPHPIRGLVAAAGSLAPGAVVRRAGAEAGRVTSAAGAVALARLARAVEPGEAVEVEVDGSTIPAEVRDLSPR